MIRSAHIVDSCVDEPRGADHFQRVGSVNPSGGFVLRAAIIALVTGLVLTPTGMAEAHARADVAFVSPRSGEPLPAGQPVEIVLAARSSGGTGTAEFTLALDGQPVDVNGRVGGGAAFTSLSLPAGKRLQIRMDAPPPGRHELRIRYAPDADDPKADVLRRFTVSPASPTPAISTATPPTADTSVGPAFATQRPDVKESGSSRPLLVGGLVVAAAIAGAVVAFAVLRKLRHGSSAHAAGAKPSA